MTSGIYSFQHVYQTVNNLVVGTEYDFSADVNLIVTNLAITESCIIYLYHDSLTSPNLIASKTSVFRSGTENWQTVAGKYTATGSDTVFGIYITCSPYRLPQLSIYFDNAILRGKGSICTTCHNDRVRNINRLIIYQALKRLFVQIPSQLRSPLQNLHPSLHLSLPLSRHLSLRPRHQGPRHPLRRAHHQATRHRHPLPGLHLLHQALTPCPRLAILCLLPQLHRRLQARSPCHRQVAQHLGRHQDLRLPQQAPTHCLHLAIQRRALRSHPRLRLGLLLLLLALTQHRRPATPRQTIQLLRVRLRLVIRQAHRHRLSARIQYLHLASPTPAIRLLQTRRRLHLHRDLHLHHRRAHRLTQEARSRYLHRAMPPHQAILPLLAILPLPATRPHRATQPLLLHLRPHPPARTRRILLAILTQAALTQRRPRSHARVSGVGGQCGRKGRDPIGKRKYYPLIPMKMRRYDSIREEYR